MHVIEQILLHLILQIIEKSKWQHSIKITSQLTAFVYLSSLCKNLSSLTIINNLKQIIFNKYNESIIYIFQTYSEALAFFIILLQVHNL